MDMATLRALAREVGTAAGDAYAQALLEAEERNQVVLPPTPVEAAAARLLAEIPGWAEEAARMPRADGSRQARLLKAAIEYRRVLADAKADGDEHAHAGG